MPKPFRKHPEMIVHGSTPFNAEPPAERLRASFVTPQDLLYVRSHGNIAESTPQATGLPWRASSTAQPLSRWRT